LENKYLFWAINAPHGLIRKKPQHIFLDHIKQCNGNSIFSFVTIALNICEGNHLATFMARMSWIYSQDKIFAYTSYE